MSYRDSNNTGRIARTMQEAFGPHTDNTLYTDSTQRRHEMIAVVVCTVGALAAAAFLVWSALSSARAA